MKMRSFTKILLLIVVSVSLFHNAANAETVVMTDAEGNRMLRMPSVPSSLTSPEARASYIAERFWDSMDFADSVCMTDKAFMEQQFANFAFMLSLSGDSVRTVAVDRCLDKAVAASKDAYAAMLEMADDYLGKPWSPAYSDELYLPFVAYAAGRDDDYAIVAKSRRNDLMKNRVGDSPADFTFTDRAGKETALSGLCGNGVPTLLLLYEPTCDDCHELVRLLATNSQISRKVSDGKLRIVAVYAGDDMAQWRPDAAAFHPQWTVGYDSSRRIEEEELYFIPFTPSTYVIDRDGKIAAKNLPSEKLIEMLETL